MSKARFAAPTMRIGYSQEPTVRFAGRREHEDPRVGLHVYGPVSLDRPSTHPCTINVGFVGTAQTVSSARAWIESCADGVPGDDNLNISFPGFTTDFGFRSSLSLDDLWTEVITQHDLRSITGHRLRKDKFQAAVDLLEDKIRLLAQKDRRPDYVVLALPEDLESYTSVDFREKGGGAVHRDLRRAFKASVMKHGLPTQVLRTRVTEAGPKARNVDHRSKCAWNFFTALYYKAGGIPWAPVGLRPGTCFVGVSFYRPLRPSSGTIRTSVAQAFDEHGDGLSLRGPDFHWDERQQHGKAPHLDRDTAYELVSLVLRRYQDERKQAPERVVVYKTSRFWPEEADGFQQALSCVNSFDLISVAPTSEFRLLRTGQYPPLRGARFQVGDHWFLYTTGYMPCTEGYPHGHVPSPLQITDHRGDTPVETLVDEILILTKMNWNSAELDGLMPITLRFSRKVGEIMKEIPVDEDPRPLYKFYM